MAKILKLPFALRNDALIHVSEVSSGRQIDCLCPECRKPLVARKGTIKTHHFAHDAGATCNLESALHFIGKTLVFSAIERGIKKGSAITLKWDCSACNHAHEGNLLKKALAVKLECPFGAARPDILLFDKTNKPFAVVEIIVTHPLEDEARKIYQEANITVVEIRLKTTNDLEMLREIVTLTAQVSLCTMQKCPKCKRPLSQKKLIVNQTRCYRCNSQMKVSFLDVEGCVLSPSQFSQRDAALAKSNGVILADRFSNTVGRRYTANTCGSCKAFIGDHFLHDYWNENGVSHEAGLFCLECETHFD